MATPKWSDSEKIALLVSLLAQHDKPIDWGSVRIPEGRTKRAAEDQYASIRKEVEKATGKCGLSETSAGTTPISSEAPKTPTKQARMPSSCFETPTQQYSTPTKNSSTSGKKFGTPGFQKKGTAVIKRPNARGRRPSNVLSAKRGWASSDEDEDDGNDEGLVLKRLRKTPSKVTTDRSGSGKGSARRGGQSSPMGAVVDTDPWVVSD